MTTLERLQELLTSDFDLDPGVVQRDARLEELDIDSLRMIEILFSVEDAFKITVPAEQAELRTRLKTVGDLADYIDTLAGAKQGAGGALP
jgi:acyl carrier protein